MNLNETDKLNLSIKSNPENSVNKNILEKSRSTSTEEKLKSDKETISIKNPEPLNIRELFNKKAETTKQVKVDYRERQINESTVKNIKEAEIKISKSTEEVINLIKQSKADLTKVVDKNSPPIQKTEPVIVKKQEPDPKLNQIIQDEISKLKEQVRKSANDKAKNETKPETLKFSQPQKTSETKVQTKPNIDIVHNTNEEVKSPVKDLKDDNKKTGIPNSDLSKQKLIDTIEKVSRTQKINSKKQTAQTSEPKVIKEKVKEPLSNTDSIQKVVLKQEQIAKTETPKKGLVELSSLTPEEKRAFFKAQKEKSGNSKNVFKVAVASIIIILTAVFLYTFIFSGSDEVVDQKLAEQTKSTISPVVENPEGQTSSMPTAEEKVETKSINPKPNTENLTLPPLPEIQTLDEPIVNLLKEESPVKKVVNQNVSEEKTTIVPPKENKIEEEEPAFFVAVEQMPEPIGGLADIQKRVIYPSVALQTGIEGKVYVRAMVNEAGVVTQTEILKGIGAGCDEAAADAVAKTKFKPGIQRGKPVKVQITIPIVFKKSQ